MIVRDLLRTKGRKVFTIGPERTLGDCLNVLNEHRIGVLLVMDEADRFLGIISERDVLRTAHDVREKMFELPVRNVMTPRERIIYAGEEHSVEHVMDIMTNNRIRHLPIMEEQTIVGLISIGDVVKALHDEAVSENKQMQNYILGHYA